MKKVALSVFLAVVSSSAFGQGQLNFSTFNINTAFGQVYLPATMESVTSLFSGQLAVSSSMGGVFTVVAPIGDFAGGGTGQPSAITVGNVTVNGFNAGDVIFYKLLVWNDVAGASFAEASTNPNGIAGMSAPVQVTLGGTPPVGLPITPPITSGFSSFALTVVPEPSVIALGILGAAAVILRRRKA